MNKLIVTMLLCCAMTSAWAADEALESIQVDTSQPAIERGLDDVMNNCHTCHTLKYIRYRDLVKLGIDKGKVDGWRGDQPLDAPLTGMMSDEAAVQSFGLVPPDLSLMTKARDGGPSYVYSYLLAYYITPEGATGNHVFPATHMPDALGISTVSDPAKREELKKTARDIVSFLTWASDPHEQERHRLGYYVIGYLVVLSVLLYMVKSQIWSRLK